MPAYAYNPYARQNVGGGSFCVYHRGECVVDVWGGDRNAAGEPWEHDTMAISWSTTKGVASMALGIIEECLRLSKDYAKTRVQFGRPIGEFQAVTSTATPSGSRLA